MSLKRFLGLPDALFEEVYACREHVGEANRLPRAYGDGRVCIIETK